MDIKELIKKLNQDKAEILYAICEDERIILPEVLLSLIYKLRSIIKTIKFINEE